MPRWKGFCGPSYVSQSPIADGEELINWYPELMESRGAKTDAVMYPTPGFEAFVTPADTPGRALFEETDRVHGVVGSGVYEIFRTGIATLRGAVARDQYPATISSNGVNQLFITSGGNGYLLDLLTNVLTAIPNLVGKATMGGSLGGYFIAFDVNTSTFYLSGLLDGLTWDPNQSAQRSLAPDPWRSMVVTNAEVWLFGEKTSEPWYNKGDFPFPFAPIGPVIQYGIAAPFSAGVLEDTILWINRNEGGTGSVLQTRGINPREVQTMPMAYAISKYADISDAQVWGYQDAGHGTMMLDFPSANVSWGFDNSNGLFHKRGFWDSVNAQYNAWRPTCHCYAWGMHLVGDRNSGTIYRMSTELGLDVESKPIRRLRRAPSLFNEHERVRCPRLEVYIESGLGLPVGQGSDPTMLMRMSKDGGKSFGSFRTAKAGKVGEHSRRVIYRRFGSGRDLVPEIVVSDPIPWRVIDAYLRAGDGEAA